ncbi:glycosyltransferase [Marinobacter nanhaiticus D15-8W]|uniref:Glycosyltransferase n=1 Tax=Marinobacter nanhaiticus D15-8W TaxID=626887 RepID=N6VST2_9GAMM|nr:glycosyltransferase [Marinobacter nanhaiticus]ENO13200.1 glycosyltransferase [Marinobacter nanhaiticus D15-8W]BES70561.1 glycosyltransferase [Marinobacter nanhaiticus D15-8W]
MTSNTDTGARGTKASVLTLVRGRQAHLDALIDGLTRQTEPAFELIIASMQPEPPRISAEVPFPVRVVTVPGERMPLAAARNAAARAADTERLIFLDVDCIPGPELVGQYIRQLDASGRCLLGEVRYLPGTCSTEDIKASTFADLAGFAVQHPARPSLESDGWIDEPEHRALWGLSFALTKDQYFSAGGMDELYVGYGGEETDFAERLAANGTRLAWCSDALALHQYHTVYTPPLDRFDDIIENATRFRATWGSWCLEYWLDYFARYGLVRWALDADRIEILRRPTPQEVEASRQGPEIAFA